MVLHAIIGVLMPSVIAGCVTCGLGGLGWVRLGRISLDQVWLSLVGWIRSD